MIFKSAAILLFAWLGCTVFISNIGDIVHGLLLVGLALLLLGILRARDEAFRRASENEPGKK